MAAWEGDLLERAEVAEFLQNLLESDGDIKVINIDSPWGTGKTFFLENWKQQLEQNRGVVYFNAWEKDYTGDPFVSLVAVIKDQLENQVGSSTRQKAAVTQFKDKAQETFLATAPVAFKLLGKGLLRKATGVKAEEFSEEIAGILNHASDFAIQSVIDDFKNSEKVIEDFEKTLKMLVDEVSKNKNGSSKKPVYILIDELDRCRPTYAVELLERVKHFFNVPGCKFVIATDTRQLQHSIKAIYGSGFESREYLKRFFDLEYSLDFSDIEEWVRINFKLFNESLVYVGAVTNIDDIKGARQHIRKPLNPPSKNAVVTKVLDESQTILLALAKTFNVSIRSLERIIRHINASLHNIKDESVHFFYLAYLVFLKNCDVDMYVELNRSDIVRAEFKQLMQKKFPSHKLYFGHSSVDIHAIAFDYIRLKGMSDVQLEEIEKQDFNYKTRLKSDLLHNRTKLDYSRIVHLASRI